MILMSFAKKILNIRVFTPLLVILIFFPLYASAGTRSKSAHNQTQGINAVSAPANPGDVIVYTLSYVNTSNISETVTIEDNLTDVLYASDIISLGGGTLQSSTLRFPALTAPANARVDRSFSVKIKQLPSDTIDNVMSNSYGNGIDVKFRVGSAVGGSVKGSVYQAPATGVSENVVLVLAGLTTLSYAIWSSRRKSLV